MRRCSILLVCMVGEVWSGASQSEVLRRFTVADEIGLAHFGDPYSGQADSVRFSPDGRYFAVEVERGRLDLNRPEDVLRIYDVRAVRTFLVQAGSSWSPAPLWEFSRSSDKDGPIITHWRWLADSSGIGFLERRLYGRHQLMIAKLRLKAVEPLTPDGEDIRAFDIRDAAHYVYARADALVEKQASKQAELPAVVVTGRRLTDLLFPVDQYPAMASLADRSQLWAVVDGRRFPVQDSSNGQNIILFEEGQTQLAMAPNGTTAVTVLPVATVPEVWEKQYPPPYAEFPYRLHSGPQDLSTLTGRTLVGRFVQIKLSQGSIVPLIDAPSGVTDGWFSSIATTAWSKDGRAVLLPGTFLGTAVRGRPCIAIVRLSPASVSCVEPLTGPTPKGYEPNAKLITEVKFDGAATDRILMSYSLPDGTQRSNVYVQNEDADWKAAQVNSSRESDSRQDINVTVSQGLNDPPVLVATDSKTHTSRIIWDPNPQLKDLELGEATVYRWKDVTNREWKAGLFRPVSYQRGARYPLVIQAHGFSESQFRPSGVFPTGFAARSLAAAGIVVLQVQDCEVVDTPDEGFCNVRGYESAVRQLADEGLVDPARVGMIGFSRTCFYVLEALTTSTLHIKAASVTDGVMAGYLQYLSDVDSSSNAVGFEFDAIVGARPFGEGLHEWIERSPLFRMDKVTAALMVVAEGRAGLAFMWEPYAAMRYLHKPVELLLLNNDEHILSNPAARLASQGGSVDWFRFWLQDYEDPNPAKAEQYKRWRDLKRLQPQNGLPSEQSSRVP